MDIETKRYSLALWMQMAHSNSAFFKLMDCGKEPQELFANPAWVKAQVGKELHPPDWEAVDEALQFAEQPNCHIIMLQDEQYPKNLRHIAYPPPVLFAIGDIQILSRPQVAMVGSRHMSHYGQKIAFDWACELASMGVIVTSGLAYGIDAAAHRGSLKGGGPTIAVLGSGLNVLYPSVHKKLAQDISAQGCVLSEFPLKFQAAQFTFPRRNRIISALSVGVVVVEANYKSGSLITARYAMEQGKEVFAVPGSIYSNTSQGCHWLIQQGAHCTTRVLDILAVLKGVLEVSEDSSRGLAAEGVDGGESLEKEAFSKEYLDLLSYIDYDITPVEIILERKGGSIAELSSMLLMLELREKIQAVPGGYVKLGFSN